MFDAFQRAYRSDGSAKERTQAQDIPSDDVLSVLRSSFGGQSFAGGLYRVLGSGETQEWSNRVSSAFPRYRGRLDCFGFDWLGRAFALVDSEKSSEPSCVFMFDLGAGEVLEIPCSIESFHDEELVNFPDAALAADFYSRWLETGAPAPEYDQCVGYKVPLFLGGMDVISNLELIDIEVYWGLFGQLLAGS